MGGSNGSAVRASLRGARLARLEKGSVATAFPLGSKPLVIGRDPASGIVVADRRASKRHATVSLQGSRLAVEDLNSHNGTYVNERRVEAGVLTPGDVLRVGHTFLIYLVDDMPVKRAEVRAAGWLVGRKWAGGGLKAPVSERPLLIGRAREADIRIAEEGFADFQAQVVAAPGGAEVIELTGDAPRSSLLADGEQLKIGAVVLKYLAVAARGRPEPAQPPAGDVIGSLEAEARRIEKDSNAAALAPPEDAGAASARAKACKLSIAVRNGPLAGKDFPFTGNRILIGSDRKAKIQLTDEQVSRFHARIRWHDGDLVIEDLDSETGVFVNGAAIRHKPLKPGDRIHIGATNFLVHL